MQKKKTQQLSPKQHQTDSKPDKKSKPRKEKMRNGRILRRPTCIEDMDVIGLAVIFAISPKDVEKPPSFDGIACMAPPLAGPQNPSNPTRRFPPFCSLPWSPTQQHFLPPHFRPKQDKREGEKKGQKYNSPKKSPGSCFPFSLMMMILLRWVL